MSRDYELFFFSILYPVVNIPAESQQCRLAFLPWVSSFISFFPLFFPSVVYLNLFISSIPIQCLFSFGHCPELFNSCSVFFLFTLSPFFSLMVCPGSLLLSYTPHPVILFFLYHKSRWGRLCVWTLGRRDGARGGWAGEEHASVTCF